MEITNREMAAGLVYGTLGYRAYTNWRQAGATQEYAVLRGIGAAAAWRAWFRGLYVAPLVLLALTGFTYQAWWGGTYTLDGTPKGVAPMSPILFFLAVVTPWGLALQAVLYCKLMDGGLFRQGWAYRTLWPWARHFVTVNPLVIYALMALPIWAVNALALHGLIA